MIAMLASEVPQHASEALPAGPDLSVQAFSIIIVGFVALNLVWGTVALSSARAKGRSQHPGRNGFGLLRAWMPAIVGVPLVLLTAAPLAAVAVVDIGTVRAEHDARPRAAVAANSHADPAALAGLANDKFVFVRLAAAANTSTLPEALGGLASDSDVGVRAAVAANPSAPQDALVMLAADRERFVRFCVGSNPVTSQTVLAVLAADRESDVRLAVARNPSASAETLTAASR